MPILADDSDEAAEEDSDAAEDEAAEEDSDAAEEDADADEADADEAELLLALALLLLVELHEHPTMPTASTAAKAMTSTFLYMIVPPLSIGAPAGRMPPGTHSLTRRIVLRRAPLTHLQHVNNDKGKSSLIGGWMPPVELPATTMRGEPRPAGTSDSWRRLYPD